jgi:hypothetical protein
MSPPDPNARYEVVQVKVTPGELREFRWTARSDDGGTLRGACPRCSHEATKDFEKGVLVGFQREPGKAVVMRCNCGATTHEGREGEDGCGAYWSLSMRTDG